MDIASSVIQVISFLFLIQIQIYNTYMLLVHAGQTGYAGAYLAYPVPPPLYTMVHKGPVRFSYNLYFSASFSAGTVFFSHTKSAGTVF